jgi:hypothetical protein
MVETGRGFTAESQTCMAKMLDDDESLQYPRLNRLPDSGLSSVESEQARLSRGKMLAKDPNYPSDKIIETLADMLARHWYS